RRKPLTSRTPTCRTIPVTEMLGGRGAWGRRASLVVFLTAAVLPVPLCAQTYPQTHPVARTTDPVALRALATHREVLERLRIGVGEEERGDWSDATAEFERVLTLHPDEPQGSTTFYDLGLAEAQLGAYEAAATSFEDAIARDDGFLAARANLVSVDLLRGDLPSAKRDAAALLQRAPTSARALYADGIVALQLDDADTALHDFGALLVRNPAYATAHYDLALAEIRRSASKTPNASCGSHLPTPLHLRGHALRWLPFSCAKDNATTHELLSIAPRATPPTPRYGASHRPCATRYEIKTRGRS
ncbi:MAG TPA: tetratricopeptide repeat protein, partial [Candidatus Acidoferrales bacterium]|nr:tetratricopeptide repeat protein [Candidatus Acidoferrales bacterium]